MYIGRIGQSIKGKPAFIFHVYSWFKGVKKFREEEKFPAFLGGNKKIENRKNRGGKRKSV
jgi:hypothetical protein